MTIRRISGPSRVGAASVALALLLLALSMAPAEARKHPRFGVSTSAVESDWRLAPRPGKAARYAKRMGARVDRLDVSWKWVQPKPGVQNMRWDRYDKHVAAIRRAGMKPLLMIHGSPYWARSNSRCRTKHCPPDVNHRDDWATFAGAVARRYGDDHLAGIEIWNSPNTAGWWSTPGGPDPRAYANVYAWAANAIHRQAPGVRVLFCSCGVGSSGQSRTDMTISAFLKGFYANVSRTILQHPRDGLAIHAYPSKKDMTTHFQSRFLRVVAEARGARNIGDVLGSDRKIWITEIGMTTTGPDEVRFTPEEQARGLVRAVKKLWWSHDIAAELVFTLVETKPNAKNPQEHGYGVLTPVTRRILLAKPAYCRLAAWSPASPRRPRGCR